MDKKYDNTMLPKGATLQTGRYKIEEYLASGGFGNTYLAINNFDEKVAIKEFFMKDINQRDGDSTKISVSNPNSKPIFEEQKAKFMKEAKRLRGFHSKHIVGVIDLFEENDTMYYVMDYIDGESLRKMIEKRGRLPEEEVRGYLIQILDALEEVHSQRIFHLDLKPANIMIDREGQVHVIDFGASKQQKADGDGATTSSALVHTPGYAPIEQNDRRLDKFGPWTDLYALGATLYNALTGKTPPSSTDIMDEGQAVFQFPETVSKEIRQLIIWMMKYARSERPQSVADVRNFWNEKPESEDKEEEDGLNEETIFADPPFIADNNSEKEDHEEPTSLVGTIIPHIWRWYYWLFFPVLLVCDTPKNKLNQLYMTFILHPAIYLIGYVAYCTIQQSFAYFIFDSGVSTYISYVNILAGILLFIPATNKARIRLKIEQSKIIILEVLHLGLFGLTFLSSTFFLLAIPIYYRYYNNTKWSIGKVSKTARNVLSTVITLDACFMCIVFAVLLILLILDS